MGVVELTAVRIPDHREQRPVLPPTVGGADIALHRRCVSRHIHVHGPLLTTGDAFSDSHGHGVLARREPSGVPGSLVSAYTAVEATVGGPPDVRQRIIVGIGCVDTEIDKVPLSARSVERCCADGGVVSLRCHPGSAGDLAHHRRQIPLLHDDGDLGGVEGMVVAIGSRSGNHDSLITSRESRARPGQTVTRSACGRGWM